MRAAHEAKIETRPFFHPLSTLPPYGKYARGCPNSTELSATGVNLPTSSSVDEQMVGARRAGVPRRAGVNGGETSAMLSSVIIGGGPGGLGPLIWAAQHGLLAGWLDAASPWSSAGHLGGTLGRFGINSDSLGGSYLDAWRRGPAGSPEATARRSGGAARWRGIVDSFPPLGLVDRFMRRDRHRAGSDARREVRLSFIFAPRPARSSASRRHGRGRSSPDRRRRQSILVARSAVMALGGRQRWQDKATRSRA